MARHKPYALGQRKLIPEALEAQILRGSFRYTLSRLGDQELARRPFDHEYNNEETGAPGGFQRMVVRSSRR